MLDILLCVYSILLAYLMQLVELLLVLQVQAPSLDFHKRDYEPHVLVLELEVELESFSYALRVFACDIIWHTSCQTALYALS